MSITELKKKLILRINQTSNNDLLEELYRLLTIDESESEFETLKLSNQQKLEISEAQEEYKKGKYLSKKNADKDIDEWLSK
jgi:hypothetical protein